MWNILLAQKDFWEIISFSYKFEEQHSFPINVIYHVMLDWPKI